MCARILRAKGDSNSPYTTLSGELKKAITKRISMMVDECNNRWKLLLRNASCGGINVEHNWCQSLEFQVGISGNLFFKMSSNLINWELFDVG